MTIAQVGLFIEEASKALGQETVNNMNAARAAYHADEQQYSKLQHDLTRDY